MNRNELEYFLDSIFNKCEFEKKHNKWYHETEELKKVIILQKSRFSNFYYLNYGFIIKNMEIEDSNIHIFSGFSSLKNKENDRIKLLMDLDSKISEQLRKKELKTFIDNLMMDKMNLINLESDIQEELMSREHLNDIPLSVKTYFKLNVENV
jgi:uncharacterized protein DUF4304